MDWDRRGEELWLTVDADDGVRVDELLRAADAAGYVDVDLDALGVALASGRPTCVGRVDVAPVPGAVEVVVADDGMEAAITIHPPEGGAQAVTTTAVRAALGTAGVKLGIDEVVLQHLDLATAGTYVVARGWAPVRGTDGRVEYLTDVTHEFHPLDRADGGVDFHAVATLPDVEAGQVIARLVDPTTGTPGRTVTGDLVPAEAGEPMVLPRGANVSVSDDGRTLVAEVDGLLQAVGEAISIRPDLVIPGDVDFESGSIEFRGDVIVRGSVLPGFRVRAGGRLIVMGDVDNAVVEAGELAWLRGSLVGGSAVLRSDGDAKVRTVRDGRIEARGTVWIERECNGATILAGHRVVLEADRNRLVGGAVWAGAEVHASEIGAAGELPTRVSVGIDPFRAELADDLRGEWKQHVASLDRLQVALVSYRDDAAVRALDERRREAVERLLAAEAALQTRVGHLEERLAELDAAKLDGEPKVVARYAMRPGTVLQIGRARLRLVDNEFGAAAVAVGRRITLVPAGMARPPKFSPSTPQASVAAADR